MIDRDSSEPMFLYLGGTLLSIILDIIFIAAAFNSKLQTVSSLCKFSAAIAIIFLISKPLQAILLYHMFKERGGDYGFNIGKSDTYISKCHYIKKNLSS